MDNGHVKVTIGQKEKVVSVPTSFSTLRDLLLCSQATTNPYRAFYAALGLCVQFSPPLPFRYEHDALEYGGKVMDEIANRAREPGITMSVREVMDQADAAALKCWHHAMSIYQADRITPEEVQQTEDFSEAPRDTTTG